MWSNSDMDRFLTFRHVLFYVLSCMKPPRSLAIYRIKRHLYSWVGSECRKPFGFGEEPLVAEGRNCECDPYVEKTGWASCYAKESLCMCWRDMAWIQRSWQSDGLWEGCLAPRRLIDRRHRRSHIHMHGGIQSTLVSLRSLCVLVPSGREVGWNYYREQSAGHHTRKNLGTSFFSLAILPGILPCILTLTCFYSVDLFLNALGAATRTFLYVCSRALCFVRTFQRIYFPLMRDKHMYDTTVLCVCVCESEGGRGGGTSIELLNRVTVCRGAVWPPQRFFIQPTLGPWNETWK